MINPVYSCWMNICVRIKKSIYNPYETIWKKKYPIDNTGNPIAVRVKETLIQLFVFIVDPLKCRLFIISSVKFYDINFWNLQLLEHP